MPKSNRDYNNLEETSSQSSADAGAGSGGVRSSSTTTSGGAGSSSFTSLPTWSSSPHALKRVDKLVSSLLSRNDSAPFREPVDWRAMELWDYPKIVRKMMDLGTIKRKLERGEYRTVQDVVADVRLVWKNCMLYNADGSDFYLLAEGFSSRFEERWKKLRTERTCAYC
uniref:Bromo domain-containing protein n=1 Tax=Corethron hystrix TaxID=216773 RepID=A0A7S1FUF8_9STRA|mmetsp:Transcript_28710/g.65587  ORF Transcript_28710/g.65587 Transcript_28710/m.65587 type:complete len:168 (+) Transcript_28710:111-614(+)